MSEGQRKTKYPATRRLLLKSKLLKKASSMLVSETEQRQTEKQRVVTESFPPLQLSGLSVQELQDLCKELQKKIDLVDDARYDMEVKVVKNETEIQTLRQKVMGLKGVKRPSLKRVKKADDMFGGLSDTSKLMKADFKVNLKTRKKEEEKKEEVTDWRKNVDAMSGMDGRKKMFDAGQ
uniref:Troponin I, slow skeletal muscle-like n=1 Tax=Gouania willdenowi TaxID=441366 RepID=A0A8C5EE17_GOUWI